MAKKKRHKKASPATLPANQHQVQTQVKRQVLQEIRGEIFSGPLPPPDTLARYDQVLPGSAERIVSMAERQQKHRHILEATVVKSDTKDSKAGLWLGFAVSITAVIGGMICIVSGNPVAGVFLAGVRSLGLQRFLFTVASSEGRKEKQNIAWIFRASRKPAQLPQKIIVKKGPSWLSSPKINPGQVVQASVALPRSLAGLTRRR